MPVVAYKPNVKSGQVDAEITTMTIDEYTVSLKTAKAFLTRKIEAQEQLIERVEAQRRVHLLGSDEVNEQEADAGK